MSIQTTGWPLIVDADDFQVTTRGVTWAIKLNDTSGYDCAIYAMVQTSPFEWRSVANLESGLQTALTNYHGGDMTRWFKERFLPKLNEWLAKYFPAGAEPTGPDLTIAEQAEKLIHGIKITVNADGTVVAS